MGSRSRQSRCHAGQHLHFPLYLLSGGVLPAWDLFAPAMFDELPAPLLRVRNTTTRIEKRPRNERLFGAAYLPFKRASSHRGLSGVAMRGSLR